MKIIFCGGGTAGHITPAIAIAQEIKKKDKNSKILFIGREGGAENELITKANFPLATITIKGFKRKFTVQNVDVLIKAINAKKEAKQIIKAFKPDIILGTGGYVCWPVIIAGHEMKIPVAIHESNIYPGMTTKMLANKCNKVFVSSEESKKYFPKKTEVKVVGNPVNKKLFTTSKAEARATLGLSTDDIFILSFGGSLGSKKLNEVIISLMRNYSSRKKNIAHLHATGKTNYKTEMEAMFSEKTRCKIVPFIDNIPLYMKAADLAICRSGAMTLTELAAAATPAILVPSPNVTANHQMKNAIALVDKNAAIVIAEDDLTEETITSKIDYLLNNEKERKTMSKCIELFAKKDVENTIFRELNSIIAPDKKS